MTVAHYRMIYELDPADQIMDGYSVMCRSDTAALAMASNGAENRAAAVGPHNLAMSSTRGGESEHVGSTIHVR
jgi:hypothetical protein